MPRDNRTSGLLILSPTLGRLDSTTAIHATPSGNYEHRDAEYDFAAGGWCGRIEGWRFKSTATPTIP